MQKQMVQKSAAGRDIGRRLEDQEQRSVSELVSVDLQEAQI